MVGVTQRTPGTVQESGAAWWTVGGPCAVVIGMLFLGAVLSTPTGGGQTLQAEPDRKRQSIDLVATAAEDARRLAEHRGGWTLQFMVACERQSLEPIVEALGDQPNFFLLRSIETGQDCYRICWGWFSSKAEAEGPRGYPDVLNDIDAMGWARPVDDVLP